MSFVQAVQVCLRKYVDFEGRAARSGVLVVCAVPARRDGGGCAAGRTVSTIVALALVLPSLGVGARRLHDIGKSGWFLLLHLLPIIGILVLIYFWVQPTQTEGNAFAVTPA